ncbi:MAG: flagellar biosynthesis protein FlhB [Alphaproteobacteria bacterium]|nr:flagellar biosynthesis protein FlhB [Alphaproteobacteria bacterium]MBL6939979.1 flagellar biosynthesis protein FlhB [Alphaproteobacteria bacterium]MBL7098165.1 flagellar biosynthesis protein FlhB [Alphaproteobacteria bacterium]
MADDRDPSQQTEEPTSKRLEQAREHGDIVKSPEVSAFVLLLGATVAIMMFGGSTLTKLASAMRIFLEQPDQMAVGPSDIMGIARYVAMSMGTILGPVFAVMIAAALAGHVLQSRPSFSIEKIMPDFSKLNIFAAFGRMFGMDGLLNLGKGLLKIGIVGVAVWTQIWPERNMLEGVLQQTPDDIVSDMSHLLFKVLMAALIALAVIAAADYILQRQRWLQRNRMSKQEIKEEYRQNEGDPQIKAKIRAIRQERAKKRMIAAVPGATVIITNPTHYAVALKYESGKMAAPICVAKGIDALALKIREVAKEHEVPIVENPPLARALHATVEVDEVIPQEHFKAVAQVIGYVMRLTGKIKPN